METTTSQGPPGPLDPERRELVESHARLASALAKPFKKANPRLRDEFESAANMALVLAASAYDLTREVRFTTFAQRRILGALRDVQRRSVTTGWRLGKRRGPAPPKVVPLGRLSRRDVNRLHVRSRPNEDKDFEVMEQVEHLLEGLPSVCAQVCRHIYVDGYSTAEAARELGVSQPRVSQIHQEALKRLRGEKLEPRTRRDRPQPGQGVLKDLVRSRAGRRRPPNSPA